MLVKNIVELIGNTPLIKVKNLVTEECAEIFAKIESTNPGGSIKDRICFAMIKDAEEKGVLKKGGTIVEATSGNTGIGLALVGASLGYKVILVMPETMSLERIYIQSSLGAEIVLTRGKDGINGAIEKAKELAKKYEAFMPLQFKNRANVDVHKRTTATEILKDLNRSIDAFVAAVGTGGTITGIGEVLKERYPSVKVIAVEPTTCAVLSGGKPGPHKIQGIGAGFIPDILNFNIIDEVIKVTDEEAFDMSKKLAKIEGVFVGISSGANIAASLKIAKRLGKGKTVVTILPDTGERYFSLEHFFRS